MGVGVGGGWGNWGVRNLRVGTNILTHSHRPAVTHNHALRVSGGIRPPSNISMVLMAHFHTHTHTHKP